MNNFYALLFRQKYIGIFRLDFKAKLVLGIQNVPKKYKIRMLKFICLNFNTIFIF